jgi:hypothetical protein
MMIPKVNTLSIVRRKSSSFSPKLDSYIETFQEWFTSLSDEAQRVFLSQDQKFERDITYRDEILADITTEFFNVDWKKTGVINNIQFFVLWRELEAKWLCAGQILMVPTDR